MMLGIKNPHPYQHFSLSKIRAVIDTMIRAANTEFLVLLALMEIFWLIGFRARRCCRLQIKFKILKLCIIIMVILIILIMLTLLFVICN